MLLRYSPITLLGVLDLDALDLDALDLDALDLVCLTWVCWTGRVFAVEFLFFASDYVRLFFRAQAKTDMMVRSNISVFLYGLPRLSKKWNIYAMKFVIFMSDLIEEMLPICFLMTVCFSIKSTFIIVL